ncbi:sensor histidine kinase [Lutispora thermophila]|uniref:GHKL domain-containing protein n=1 Tax=Lutispora thermophila DSM 19022 TaxID=1122184 RepID=A0A1M6DV87_9FIRM|nr:ATP-binding protein [Lutispora thermophila]SHI77164.1 GHKL domain-containing protein [Lutispora thermophila DSM 19022]
MIETIIEFSRYFAAMLFAMSVAASFVGMPFTRKNRLVMWSYIILVFIIQVTCLFSFGMDITWKIYPLIAHVPIAAFIAIYLKRSLLISITTMFAAFLCCQPPRWIGSLASAVTGNVSLNHLGYIISVIFMYHILRKYVAKSVQHLMERSTKSCLIFGAVPAFYYLVDYSTTVYTDFLYSGTRVAVQFMPFIISAFYFIFVISYYGEIQKQTKVERERDMLVTQFRQAQIELESLRQIQENAAAYRHDMRHNLALLQGLASKGLINEINEYLKTVQSDIDAITPIRYCENETVNLIISSFAAKAKQSQIMLTVNANLTELLKLSDTEICSLLSNALENAIHACQNIADKSKRFINLRLFYKNNKLCIDIRNSYETEPIFHEGLPVSTEQGHGYGTKSMAHIVEKHGGVFQFSVKDGCFIFQATA